MEEQIAIYKKPDLSREDVFYNVFATVSNLDGEVVETIFDKEKFNDKCVEVYLPGAAPEFTYPPSAIEGVPGIALVITQSLEAQQFTGGDFSSPTTPEEAKKIFLDERSNPYATMIEWGMGLNDLEETEGKKVEFVVNGQLFDSNQVKKMLQSLQEIALETGVLEKANVSRNPYSADYQQPALGLER